MQGYIHNSLSFSLQNLLTAFESSIACEHLMQLCVMMQTSLDANLVSAEHSAVGVARALALLNPEKILDFLFFKFFCISRKQQSLCIQ